MGVMESALLATSRLSWIPYHLGSSHSLFDSIPPRQIPTFPLTSSLDSRIFGSISTRIQLIRYFGSSNSVINASLNNCSKVVEVGLADPQPQWKQGNSRCHCKPRLVCLFGSKGGAADKDAARRALENALSGKKDAFVKWDGEIKKREAAGGGGGNGGRRWFGGFGNEDSWKEIQQASFAVAGLILLYLLVAKGKSMMSVAVNSMLFFLRGFRNGLRSIYSTSRIVPESSSSLNNSSKAQDDTSGSAKANVIRKWGPE